MTQVSEFYGAPFAPFPHPAYTHCSYRTAMIGLRTLRAELRPTLRLALPLVLAELGWMSMAVVDTIMVGRLSNSAVAIAAVSLGGILVHTLAFFGGGLLVGLDTLVSQAFGAGQREDCHRSLVHGIYLSFALAPLLMAPVWFFDSLLRYARIAPEIIALAVPYSKALAWGTLPLLLYFAVRRCMQGMNMVRPIAFALVTANIINAVGNWLLIYGKLGAPAMGAVGSGWSTAWARIYLAAVLVGYLLWYDRKYRTDLLRTPIQPDLMRIKRLIALGLPAAMQISLEIGVFAFVTALIGRLGAVPLASHQIALNTVSLTYMVPLGISSAAAVRVGQAIGRKDPTGASDAGDSAIFFGAGFMTLAGIALLLFPRGIARLYTPDPVVIRNTILLLAAGAAFQLFDGIQTVATGALRGAGDTRTPMLCHFTAYWIIGLPLGAWLCFRRGWGAFGLWAGLSLALILIGIVLLFAWRHMVKKLMRRRQEA
ncbi:MAG TPA: MATE family efflux transporter [Candidatus Acidoferrum sp.]|nr:MATE family efflux transporter [Candidatus Acidoferrum sp.]